ncbi:alpha/beta hydrolase family protein [Solimicrobium silvestre]|uniref:Alpha/beta hydrolase family n=1 Tax=Solimicrobium silvestre TaxID=2099400 RepID=A0A2S9H3Y0_9BURK|nr:alpha/beta fold hydrolase [Solimicrobium silvestre]PRC94677.1 Alpha/beta hydrolase family [Solimicrobium silvestre]
MQPYLKNTLILVALLALPPLTQAETETGTEIQAAAKTEISAETPASLLKDHKGYWLGDLKIPNGPTLKIGAELFTRADGSYWASVSSPDQDAYDIPVKSIHGTGDALELDFSFAAMKLTWVNDHFMGDYKQGDFAQSMEMKQVSEFPMKVRAQTPKAPFPYKDETLAISSTDGVTLGATLSIPNGKTHPNVVILVSGSGPNNRDEDAAGHQPFAVLADYLARQGVAVLRYDKRGVGRSTGDYEQHTTAQLIDDLNAVVQALKARKEFNHLGLIGHSEGPGIAAAVAAHQPKSVDFVISLAGVGLPGLDMMLLQDHIWAKDHGASPAEEERILTIYVQKFYETIIAQADVEPRIVALKALYSGLAPEDQALVKKLKMNMGSLSLAQAKQPGLRTLLMSNPALDWRMVRCPVLALNGSLDHQVPVESLAGIVAALKAGGNPKVESAILPSLNHLFQTAKTGGEEEYDKIDETIAPGALQKIAAFSIQH